ncbi:MAG: hypothetical protein JXA21_20850 [Anaerolineae bacterium]|nr:hypothetical protein [Anaerolineae bacterium]
MARVCDSACLVAGGLRCRAAAVRFADRRRWNFSALGHSHSNAHTDRRANVNADRNAGPHCDSPTDCDAVTHVNADAVAYPHSDPSADRVALLRI